MTNFQYLLQGTSEQDQRVIVLLCNTTKQLVSYSSPHPQIPTHYWFLGYVNENLHFKKTKTKHKIRESNWPSTPHENLQKNEGRSGHHGRGTTRCAYRLILSITGKVARRGKERKHRKKHIQDEISCSWLAVSRVNVEASTQEQRISQWELQSKLNQKITLLQLQNTQLTHQIAYQASEQGSRYFHTWLIWCWQVADEASFFKGLVPIVSHNFVDQVFLCVQESCMIKPEYNVCFAAL